MSRISQQKIKPNERATISFDVKNIGDVAGDEVVQLYLHDIVGSVSRPLKELKGFKRITLKPGEKRTIEFELMPDDLAMLDINLNWIVEPGQFEVMIGSHCFPAFSTVQRRKLGQAEAGGSNHVARRGQPPGRESVGINLLWLGC